MNKDIINERMKNNYENRSKTFLTRRTPVIIRIDGKAFHTYTRGLDKPFDEGLIQDMNETAIYLCQNIQGAKCAYVQSDEISIVLTAYDNLGTQAWFDYNVQKMHSISASLATAKFNQLRSSRYLKELLELDGNLPEYIVEQLKEKDAIKLANFDSRVFNIPKDEVANYFLARQKDAVKNSIFTVAQSLYSQKELENKNGDEQQEMIFQKGINWNDFPSGHKRGRTILKNTYVNNKLIEDKQEYVIGDLWYQPNNQSQFYPDKRGRLLELSEMEDCNGFYEDWCDIKIESIKTKWEVVETPLSFDETFFKKLIN